MTTGNPRVLHLNPDDPSHLIPFAMAQFPGTVAVLPVFTPAHPELSLILKATTKVKRIPADVAKQIMAKESGSNGAGAIPTEIELGRALLQMPVDLVNNIKGPAETRDLIYLFVVRREVYDGVKRQSESRIIMPGMEPGVIR